MFCKLAWVATLGPHLGADTDNYLFMAGTVLGRRGPDLSFPLSYELLYFGYPTFVAPFLYVFGQSPSFLEILALAQAAVSALAVVLFHRTMRLLTIGPDVALAVSVAFALNPEILLWDRTLTTDSLNLSVVVLSSHYVLKALWNRRLYVGLLWLVAALFMRPTNLVYLSISCIALAAIRGFPRVAQILLTLVIGIVAVALLVWGRRYDVPIGTSFLSKAESGVVIDDRPQYDVASVRSREDPFARAAVLAQVAVRRVLLFWAPSLEGYSLRHALANVLTLVPLWLLVVARLVWLYCHGADPVDRYLVWLLVAYPLFHAFTMLDFDLRYRLSVLPFAHLLAARELSTRSVSTPR